MINVRLIVMKSVMVTVMKTNDTGNSYCKDDEQERYWRN